MTGGPVAVVARALRCTEGQMYTLVLGLLLAILLAVGGVPAVLRAHPTGPTRPSTTTITPTGASRP